VEELTSSTKDLISTSKNKKFWERHVLSHFSYLIFFVNICIY